MCWHPTDPAAPRAAVATFAKLVAGGAMTHADAEAAMLSVPAPGADPSGRRARATWALRDAVDARLRSRRQAVWAGRRALAAPLAARAPRAVLEATIAAADPGGALDCQERAALLRQEVRRALAGQVQPGWTKTQ
jgi:hypothetical protein